MIMPANVQTWALLANKLAILSAVRPALVKPMVTLGKRFATATPINALAACICSSAARMSGRCSSNVEGSDKGNSVGNFKELSLNLGVDASSGNLPVRAFNRSRCSASCFSNGGRVASEVANAASWVAMSDNDASPHLRRC